MFMKIGIEYQEHYVNRIAALTSSGLRVHPKKR